MAKPFAPDFRTDPIRHNQVELAKLHSNGMRGSLRTAFRSPEPDLDWETEQLAKSYGIYLEFDREKNRSPGPKEKNWMYMVRFGIPGGGPLSPEQWRILDVLADRYARNPDGVASLRLTTRQNIQFHWVSKRGVLDIVKTAAEAGILSLNGCGDNVRNVLACPLALFTGIDDSHRLARSLAGYFQLSSAPYLEIFEIDPSQSAISEPRTRFRYGPQLLNRKFKIAVGGVHRDPVSGEMRPDNCVELRTHDLGIVPLAAPDGSVDRYQIYVGGGQGENLSKATLSMLSQPLGIAAGEALLPFLDAVVAVQQEWGDRNNRHWARLKYLILDKGLRWFRQQVEARAGLKLAAPLPGLDLGSRELHHGWRLLGEGSWAFGLFIENGRIADHEPNGRLKTMIRELAERFDFAFWITPNQDLLLTGIAESQKPELTGVLTRFGYGLRHGIPHSNLRRHSGACVGRDTCRLAYTDSEKFEPELLDRLETMGWGWLRESIGITGCERQCFRPATKTVGLVGTGKDRYMLKLLGDVGGTHQGVPLTESGNVHLRAIPRERVAEVLDVLFRFYLDRRQEGESMGTAFRRLGTDRIAAHLKEHGATSDLMAKPISDPSFELREEARVQAV